MEKKKAYYAHSLHLYNSVQKTRDVELLESLGWEVINPNIALTQESYQQWVKKNPTRDSMDYFREIVKNYDILAYRSHVDLKIGSDVFAEIETAIEMGIPIIELPTITDSRKLSINETKQYLKYNGQR